MRSAIRSQHVVTAAGVRPATVFVEDRKIRAIEAPDADVGSMPVADVGNLYLLPGLVDTHIHINQPGRTEWEGFSTASRAAAAGGYTCLVDMPLNSIPATTDVSALETKRHSARGICLVDHAFWGGAVKGNASELLSLARAGVRGFKSFLVDSGIPEFAMMAECDLRSAMPLIAQTGLPLLVHAENPAVIAKANGFLAEECRRYEAYLQSRPDSAEVVAIELLIRLCREYHCRLHIVHLSSAEAIPVLKVAQQEGLTISVETCPHYLYFAGEQIPEGATQFKCAPPIRNEQNREALWDALGEGTIRLIATDHSPCPPEMKRIGNGDFSRAWGGIASVSLALSVMWTSARPRGFDITDIVRWMSQHTALLAGLQSRKGQIAPGFDADLVVFDPDQSFVVQASDLYFRHPISPYLGEHLQGRVLTTFLGGEAVFDRGTFIDGCPGRECRVSEWSTA